MAKQTRAYLKNNATTKFIDNPIGLIKAETSRNGFIDNADSFLTFLDDANTPGGYLSMDETGKANIIYISAASPSGNFLRDDGTWASAGTTALAVTKILVGNSSNIATAVNLTMSATAGTFSLSAAGALTFPNATTALRGLLTSDDWNTFYNKQPLLGYTPIDGTLTAGNVYVGDSSNVATARSLTLSSTAGPFALNDAGVYTMPNATTSLRGFLTATDWNTFNGKQAALGYTPVNKSGDTMTGDLILNANATTALGAVTLQQLTAAKVGIWNDRGNWYGSENAFPEVGGSGTAGALLRGDVYTIIGAGVFSGVVLNGGDLIRVLVNNPGQTAANWAVTEGNLGYTPLSNVLSTGYLFIGDGSNTASQQYLSLSDVAGDFDMNADGIITMPNATAGQRGFLTATDWNTFNGKQAALGYTPTDSYLTNGYIYVGNVSNVATVTSLSLNADAGPFNFDHTGTLTFPDANGSGRGFLSAAKYVEFSGKLDAVLADGKIYVGDYAGLPQARTLSLNASSAAFGIDNLGVLSMPNAYTSGRGLLTATDWNTFNDKLSTSLNAGYIFIGNSSNIATPRTLTLSASSGSFSLGDTGTLTMRNADDNYRGLLTPDDWGMFNDKQDNLGYTPVDKAGDTMTGNLAVPNFTADQITITSMAGFGDYLVTVDSSGVLAYTELVGQPSTQIAVGNGSGLTSYATFTFDFIAGMLTSGNFNLGTTLDGDVVTNVGSFSIESGSNTYVYLEDDNTIEMSAGAGTVQMFASAGVFINSFFNVGNKTTTNQRAVRFGQDSAWADIGSLPGATSVCGLWFNQSAPSSGTPTIAGDGNNTYINAPGASSGVINFNNGFSTMFVIGSTGAKTAYDFEITGTGAGVIVKDSDGSRRRITTTLGVITVSAAL